VFVKICGITTEEDALFAVAMGADAIGFVFAPSTRQVVAAHVARITPRLPPEILTVGVFRDDHPEHVVEVVFNAGLKAAQLHGHETHDDIVFVASHVRHVFKAYPAESPDLARAGSLPVEAILIDAPLPGSGKVFDWRLAERVPAGKRIILAGGLGPANVAEAIRQVRPWGVDASTELEAAPGRKDPAKVLAFIKAAKGAIPDEDEDELERFGADGGRSVPYDWQEDK
jgi:phosphoribosylanthranilate isomerase